jgi:hypothetical protein
MTKPSRGRAKAIERVTQKTLVAAETRQRVVAIVGQVIDELEQRRANGKSDYVAALAKNHETGDLASWKVLKDLLGRDELDTSGAAVNVNLSSLFVKVAAEVGARNRHPANTTLAAPSEKVIDVPFERVAREDVEVIETNPEENDGHGAVDW